MTRSTATGTLGRRRGAVAGPATLTRIVARGAGMRTLVIGHDGFIAAQAGMRWHMRGAGNIGSAITISAMTRIVTRFTRGILVPMQGCRGCDLVSFRTAEAAK